MITADYPEKRQKSNRHIGDFAEDRSGKLSLLQEQDFSGFWTLSGSACRQ